MKTVSSLWSPDDSDFESPYVDIHTHQQKCKTGGIPVVISLLEAISDAVLIDLFRRVLDEVTEHSINDSAHLIQIDYI